MNQYLKFISIIAIFFLLIINGYFFFSSKNNTIIISAQNGKRISKKRYIDFGTLNVRKEYKKNFKIINSSEAQLRLSPHGSTCGCTRIICSTKPILPGQASSVSVVFNPKRREGLQKQSASIAIVMEISN